LDDVAQEELRTINARLTELESQFGRKLLAGANEASVFFASADDLEGLPQDAIDAAAAAAKNRGREGEYLVELQLPTQQAALSGLARRDVRERVYNASINRGATGGENDTRATILETVKLRARAAKLLGYEHHGAYIAEDATAKTTEAVNKILADLTPAAVANARAEAVELERALRQDLGDDTAKLEPWDWQYYAEKVRLEKYSLDDSLLRPYLELERVVSQGVFAAANKLYGISFVERPELKGYHDDVRVFEVFNEDGSGLGLFLADFFTRESKRGGAWMNNLVDQSGLTGYRAVVVNNLNIPKAPEGQPTLLTWDEVITLFHEFGHALHGLFSDVHYPSHSGTEVARDFVEFPSQVNEMWAWEPQILAQYAVHFQTGEPMPAQWIDTLNASRLFNEGFSTTEYLSAALLDQAWHQITEDEVPSSVDEVVAFEQAALARAGVDLDVVPPRYRTTYYNHIFGGGYSAGYYSYIWSEVLDADTVTWFEENGGLKRENGDYFRSTLLSRGGSADSLKVFEQFRGRPQIIEPLIARRGLNVAV
jgi:peptidyl-dipeptidase Dcp